MRPTARASVLALLTFAAPLAGEESGRIDLADGIEMAYVDRGQGEPALVFVHCGNCRKEIWSETLDAFAGERRVVAMDLPGYGESDAAGRERFTIESYGADVAALVEQLGLQRIVLVGNSLGGPIALEVARSVGPARVAGVVAVDTLQNVEAVWPEENWRRRLEAYRRDFRPACDELMLALLPASASAESRARIERETCENDPRAAIALFETLRGYDQGAGMRAAGVPVVAINSDAYPTAVETNRKYAPSFELILMPGVGHYPQVERPDEFQRHLRDAVARLAAPRDPERTVAEAVARADGEILAGRLDAAARALDAAAAEIDAAEPTPLARARLAVARGKLAQSRAFLAGPPHDEAIAALRAGLAAAEAAGDEALVATARDRLALALFARDFRASEHAEARALLDAALAARRGLDDQRGVAETLFHLGLTHEHRAEPGPADAARAAELYRESLAAAEAGGFGYEASYPVRHLAGLSEEGGDLAAALAGFERSLALRREAGATLVLAPALTALADNCAARGEPERARELYREALDVARRIGAVRFERDAAEGLAKLEHEELSPP